MRHVVITGAGGGLGAALAVAHARRGDRLTLLGRDPARLERTADRVRALGKDTALLGCRCADVADGDMMAEALVSAERMAPVDVVVANAGVGGRTVLAPDTGEPAALVRDILEVNVIGVANTFAPLVPHMVARRRGRLVAVGSAAGDIGLAQSPAYCASKAAVRIYAQALRRRLAWSGVRVTHVSPGFVDTPMSASLPFARPFLVSADAAAERIVGGIEREQDEIAFPWQLHMALRIGRHLPDSVLAAVLGAFAPPARPAA